jgi:hypothetical protein
MPDFELRFKNLEYDLLVKQFGSDEKFIEFCNNKMQELFPNHRCIRATHGSVVIHFEGEEEMKYQIKNFWRSLKTDDILKEPAFQDDPKRSESSNEPEPNEKSDDTQDNANHEKNPIEFQEVSKGIKLWVLGVIIGGSSLLLLAVGYLNCRNFSHEVVQKDKSEIDELEDQTKKKIVNRNVSNIFASDLSVSANFHECLEHASNLANKAVESMDEMKEYLQNDAFGWLLLKDLDDLQSDEIVGDEKLDNESLIEITESERRDAMNQIGAMKNDIEDLQDAAARVEMAGFESVTIVIEKAKKEAALLEILIGAFQEEMDEEEKSLEDMELLMEQCAEDNEEELEKLQNLEGEKMTNEEKTKVRMEKVEEILIIGKSLEDSEAEGANGKINDEIENAEKETTIETLAKELWKEMDEEKKSLEKIEVMMEECTEDLVEELEKHQTLEIEITKTNSDY